jgi:MarR family transcriptional regulator, organic hydroperoxide resistance regulator
VAKGIQAEIKQEKPFASLQQEALLSVMRTADRLQWQVAETLKPYGLSPTQYNALRILRGAGAEGLPCGEIGERMINRDPDITRLLDRLEKRKLVERRRSAQDRRVISARISAAGLDLLKSLDRPVSELLRRLLRDISDTKLKALIQVLGEVRQGIG